MRYTRTRQVALTGMLFALAIVLGYLESLVTPLLGLPPGVKPGLANIVVMYALYFLTRRQALLLVVLKAGFGFLSRGAIAGMLSLAGGLLSWVVMALLLLPKNKPSVLLVSVAGALCHNIGQLAVVALLYQTMSFYYLPVLLISGIVMGAITSVSLRVMLPALKRTGPGQNPDKTS